MDQIIFRHAVGERSCFGNTRFDIDYYQREYRWEQKTSSNQILDDLYRLNSGDKAWSPAHDRVDVETVSGSHYFLGPVILVTA